MTELIRPASSVSDYAAFAQLITEYIDWCRERYQAEVWFVNRVFSHQSFASELEVLATSYGPPRGKTLLAFRDGQVCGGGAYRKLPDGSCEMKRLFVRSRFAGQGIGRRLGAALIQSARDEGFQVMKLDTGNLLREAISMYKSMGFRECAPYHDYPQELMPYLVFMELRLTDGC